MKFERVVIAVEGGLGNQLFQFAAGYALSARLGSNLALDLRLLHRNGDRPLYLTRYPVQADILTDSESAALPDVRSSRVRRCVSRLSLQFPAWVHSPIYWAEQVGYDPRFERITGPRLLVGYWQSERYFRGNRSELLSLLQPTDALRVRDMVDRARNCMSVAVHIRRGDYITNPVAAQTHGVVGLDYYTDAVRYLKTRVGEFKAFVFTDDPDWVRSHLQMDTEWELMDAHSGADAHLDLEIMRNCRHHIIANSTFSWWGAWLGDALDKVVVAPKKWFASGAARNDDLIPSEWVQL